MSRPHMLTVLLAALAGVVLAGGCRSTGSAAVPDPVGGVAPVAPSPPAVVQGEHLLIIGGGPAPDTNQLSLAANVQRLQSLLADRGRAPASTHLYFADGADPGADLQVLDPSLHESELDWLLRQVLGPPQDSRTRYRDSALPAVDGPASHAAVDGHLAALPACLPPHSRLLLYVTAHGGAGPKDRPVNTSVWLWHNIHYPVSDLMARLETLPADRQLVCVMVQCYSGGFADMIFTAGDPEKGLSPATRVGFFATTHDRQAAGCTPTVSDPDYQEYSTHFWPALFGATRDAAGAPAADYDRDGSVCLAEAHAYVQAHAQTIDVPTKTSDRLLRHYAAATRKTVAAHAAKHNIAMTRLSDCWYTESIDRARLLDAMQPEERAVWDTLAADLGLGPGRPTEAVAKLQQETRAGYRQITNARRELNHRRQSLEAAIRFALRYRWPALNSPWTAESRALLDSQGDAIVQALQQDPQLRYAEYRQLCRQEDALSEQVDAYAVRFAKLLRLQRLEEHVVLRHNLPLLADPAVQATYARLCRAEHAIWPPAAPRTP